MSHDTQVTNGATFLAHVYYEACQKARGKEDDWWTLSVEERCVLAEGAQMLVDLQVVDYISYLGAKTLRRNGWKSAFPKKEVKQDAGAKRT